MSWEIHTNLNEESFNLQNIFKYLAQIMNKRPQPTEFTKIIETINMFINSDDTPFMKREI